MMIPPSYLYTSFEREWLTDRADVEAAQDDAGGGPGQGIAAAISRAWGRWRGDRLAGPGSVRARV